MKFKILILLALICFSCKNETKETKLDNNLDVTTTFYLIRHAEKDLTTKIDPGLTRIGINRTKLWSNYFNDKSISKVYSTDFKRTIATAKPTAEKLKKKITFYQQNQITKAQLLKNNSGKNILIVGHSNTIPFLANKIIEKEVYNEIDEKEYDHLYEISIKNGIVEHKLIKVN